MRFLVHGSIAYDLLLQHDGSFLDGLDAGHLQELSVSYFMPHFAKHHGGTGANIAWNLRLLGQEPHLIGTVGHDGAEYLALLRERGVSTEFVETLPEHATATAVIGTDHEERQITFFHPGADAHGSLPSFNGNAPEAQFAIVGARNRTLMIAGAHQCHTLGIPYLFDPGQAAPFLPRDDFRRAVKESAGMIVNEYEWSLASEALGWSEADVMEACGLLVVTRGEEGLTLQTRDGTIEVPACKAENVVNPTGAGDALRAGILVGLASDARLEDAGRLGAVMGSFVVEQEGTLLDALDAQDIASRYQENYGEELRMNVRGK